MQKSNPEVQESRACTPVILDTDIGGDIDDTWALAMLLKSPELDIRMISTATGDTEYRARIVAKLLEITGRTDIPIAIGVKTKASACPQLPWVQDYDLDRYPGQVHRDGVAALHNEIGRSKDHLNIICIGPLPNIAGLLSRDPLAAVRLTFTGMHGSIARSSDGKEGAIPEYNVVHDVKACQQVFNAKWRKKVITPLDTCGRIRLTGERYAAVRDSNDPLTRAVIENYRIWAKAKGTNAETRSSILFDTVAVYLAFTTKYLKMQHMGIRVTDDGFTRPDDTGPGMDVAIDWLDLDAYLDFLVKRMLSPGIGPV